MAIRSLVVADAPRRLRHRCASRLAGVAAVATTVVVSVVAAHVWGAFVRCGGDAADPLAAVRWSSVWLWVAMVLTASLAYRAGLAWTRRNDERRLESRLRREGAP